MFDAKILLDQLLGAGGAQPGAHGGQQRPGLPTAGGGAGDLLKKAQELTGGNLGGMAGAAIAGTLASVLLGGGGSSKKSASPQLSGSALTNLGGLAILGGLAYKAWQNYQQKQGGQTPPPPPAPQSGPVQIAPPPPQTPFAPDGHQDEQNLGQLLISAMIAAARSDGRIDGGEIAKIREGMKAAGAGGDEQTFLIEQLGKPDDLDAIAAQARNPELASEVWLAARLTIDPDTAAERQFLQTFAQKLGLDAGLVSHLEATAAQAKQSGVAAA